MNRVNQQIRSNFDIESARKISFAIWGIFVIAIFAWIYVLVCLISLWAEIPHDLNFLTGNS